MSNIFRTHPRKIIGLGVAVGMCQSTSVAISAIGHSTYHLPELSRVLSNTSDYPQAPLPCSIPFEHQPSLPSNSAIRQAGLHPPVHLALRLLEGNIARCMAIKKSLRV